MEPQDGQWTEELESEGSTATAHLLLNFSQDGVTNVTNATYVTNVTFSPYYQHSMYVAAGYILAYFFIFLLCMVGNILVCLIVLENRRMRTVTNLFILNLAISDLLVGIFCIPTTLVDNLITGWPFSNWVCKISGFVQGVSVSSSVFTLVAIAVERFRCIVYPLQPKPTIPVAKGVILLIWALAVAFMCPTAVALTVERVPHHYMVYDDDLNNTVPLYTCYEDFTDAKMRKVYTAVLFTHIYLLPLAFITVMYGSIGVKLYLSVMANRERQLTDRTVQVRCRRGGQQMISRKKIKVIKMLILVALVFLLSWLPLWTLLMMADYAGLTRSQLDLLASNIFPFAHWLAFSNSSINPIIYGYYNENFKRGFQAVCKSRPFCCCFLQCDPWKTMVQWSRKGKSVQPCGGGDARPNAGNPNDLSVGLQNQLRNDKKSTVVAEMYRSVRVESEVDRSDKSTSSRSSEMLAAKKKANNTEESERVTSMAVSVHQAWDN